MSEQQQTELKHIPLAKIQENPVALRTVNRTSEEYLGLVDSIKIRGVLNPINVREVRDPDSGELIYGLIDGLHRYTASIDAGRETIPAQVINLTDAEILEAQVMGNVHKVETKPAQYSSQLMRIISQNPMMMISELATRLGKSPKWLSDRLSLIKLTPQIQELVDDNKVNLSNAYALAKLPLEEQPNFLDRAMTQGPNQFVPTVNARVKELRELKKQGKDASSEEFVAVPHLRKLSELKEEMDHGTIGPGLCKQLGVKTAPDGFNLGLAWALNMDAVSVEVAREKDRARRAELAAAKEKRDKEKAEKKAAEARTKALEADEALKKLQEPVTA